MFSTTVLGLAALLGVLLICLSRALVWLEAKRQRQFRQSTDKIAIGFPSARTMEKFDQEMLSIYLQYRLRFRAIKRAQNEFGLSRSLMIKRSDGSAFLLRDPSKFLNCDVILGESLAGAGYTPGSAIYWLPVPGEDLARSFAKRTSDQVISVQAGHLQIAAGQEKFTVKDNRRGAIPSIDLLVGTPLVLRLDEASENRMQNVLADEAPPRGKSKKIRLFGGLRQVEGEWMIVPLRQETSMTRPVEGDSVHPLSSLVGVVVAKSQDKAFVWTPPSHRAETDAAA